MSDKIIRLKDGDGNVYPVCKIEKINRKDKVSIASSASVTLTYTLLHNGFYVLTASCWNSGIGTEGCYIHRGGDSVFPVASVIHGGKFGQAGATIAFYGTAGEIITYTGRQKQVKHGSLRMFQQDTERKYAESLKKNKEN